MRQPFPFVVGRQRPRSSLVRLMMLAAALSACRGEAAPLRAGDDPGAASSPPSAPVTVEPAAPLDAVPRVLWIRVQGPVDPARIVLVHGHAGPSRVAEVRRGELSSALQSSLVPIEIWGESVLNPGDTPDGGAGQGGGPPTSVVVAPTVPLEPGDEYALVSGEPARATPIHVMAADPAELLARVWPPPDGSATAQHAVWCGDAPLPPIDEPAQPSPAGPRGRIRRGIAAGDLGERCLRFEPLVEAESDEQHGQPPPSLSVPAGLLRLDPRPIAGGTPGAPVTPLSCDAGETPFGPGCASVADDRITVRAPAAPALWTIQGPSIDRVVATGAGEAFMVRGLVPASTTTLHIATVDNRGIALHATFIAATLTPMPHPVLSEVLANPIGPEPQQEWVEIVNDGSAAVDLGGYVLIDVGGETILPTGTLPPGGFALIVNQAFVDADGVDPAPDPGALILRVSKLGHGGLSNGGEPLALRNPNGVVISRSPVGPRTKAGISWARVDPVAGDLEKSTFAAGAPTPGRPNAP